MKALTTSVAVAALAAMLGSAPAAQAARAYIGTYTVDPKALQPSGKGEGIYLATTDDATGAPTSLKLVAKTVSPSWLACTSTWLA